MNKDTISEALWGNGDTAGRAATSYLQWLQYHTCPLLLPMLRLHVLCVQTGGPFIVWFCKQMSIGRLVGYCKLSIVCRWLLESGGVEENMARKKITLTYNSVNECLMVRANLKILRRYFCASLTVQATHDICFICKILNTFVYMTTVAKFPSTFVWLTCSWISWRRERCYINANSFSRRCRKRHACIPNEASVFPWYM